MKWLYNVLAAVSRTLNALLGGDPAMTLSDRMGRDSEAGVCPLCTAICRLLSVFDPDHCRRMRDPRI